jgi:hypothetical protein
MHRFATATPHCPINQVIVNQRSTMDEFCRCCRMQNPLELIVAEACGKQDHGRTQAFSAGLNHMLAGRSQIDMPGLASLQQQGFNVLQIFGEAGLSK